VSDLAEELGAGLGEVVGAMGMDPRIGSGFLSAGLRLGDFCLPKDLQAFVHLAERSGKVDRFVMGYDDGRAGTFEPSRWRNETC
jgi:UDP-glucose 6-dehydrogenase